MNYLNSNRLRIISQQLTSLFGTSITGSALLKKEKQLSVRIKSAPRLSDLQFHGLTCSLKPHHVFTSLSVLPAEQQQR